MPAVVSLIGKANSGKTTLLERLIPALITRGVRVGTIKHHHGTDFIMDYPGKDTWRHKQAGASVVALSSPSGVGLVRDTDHDLSLEELVEAYFQDVDLVLTEGYKGGAALKVELFRAEAHREPLANRDESWLAMVSDQPLECGIPLFHPDQVTELADFLLTCLGTVKQTRSNPP